MPKTDPRVNAYIAKAQPFAKPILIRFRKAVHAGCPDVTETMKWSFPHFDYKGVLCSTAAFKAHCAFGTPAYMLAAIRKNKKARAAYEAFSPSHQREYVEWITEAKSDETRGRRLETAVQWMAEGKSRKWKYQR